MRLLIILGLSASLSAVSCRLPQALRREAGPLRRYKDTKNKRGIGDYPFNLNPYSSSPFQTFQSAAPISAAPFGFGSSYGGISPGYPAATLGAAPLGFGPANLLGLSSQQSPSFASLGSISHFGGFGGGLGLNPLSSGYGIASGSDVSLANLIGGSSGTQSSSFSNSGLSLLAPEKTFGGQSMSTNHGLVGQASSYTPMYASSSPIGSSSNGIASYATSPLSASSSSPGQLSALVSSLTGGGGGLNYPGDSQSAHSLFGGSSASGYGFPVSLTSAPSSPRYAVSIPPSSYSSASSNGGHGNSAGSSSPSSSSISSSYPAMGGLVMRYADGTRSSFQLAVPNYSNDGAGSKSTAGMPLTSYGTPAMPYSVPSTSYGTPSTGSNSISSGSSSNYNSPYTPNYASSSYSSSTSSSSSPSDTHALIVNSYGMSPASLSYQADSAYKSSGGPGYDSSSYDGGSSSSSDDNSISSYRNPDDSTYSQTGDLSAAYSSLTPRYIRYPYSRTYGGSYVNNNEAVGAGSSHYDTISYSVPSGKY